MTQYTFTSKQDQSFSGNALQLTMTFESIQLAEVIEQFEMFLKGCGYHFEGHLDFVDDEV